MTTLANSTQVIPVKKGDNITIIGRRWFDKVNGNTYFSAVGLVNGVQVVTIEFEYGYDRMYEQRTYEELFNMGYFPTIERSKNTNSLPSISYYCRENGINLYVTHSDVSRKKDL